MKGYIIATLIALAIAGCAFIAVFLLGMNIPVDPIPSEYVKLIGNKVVMCNSSIAVRVPILNPSGIGRKSYEIHNKDGFVSISGEPSSDPNDTQILRYELNLDYLLLKKNGNNNLLLPLVKRPVYQVGLFGLYIERYYIRSTYFYRVSDSLLVVCPVGDDDDEYLLVIRYKSKELDSGWRYLEFTKKELMTGKIFKTDDIRLLDQLDNYSHSKEVLDLINIALLHPYLKHL